MWVDAVTVIGLRSAKIAAGGPAAQREMALMVDEKLRAAGQLHSAMMRAGPAITPARAAARALAIYAPKVRANRVRLQKPK